MEIKKTLTLSALLHVILFAAALLLFRGSRNMQAEDLFFVNLTEDIKRSGAEEVAEIIVQPVPSLSVKEEKHKLISKVQLKPALLKTIETTVRNDLSTEPEPVKNASSSKELSVDATTSDRKEISAATATLVIDDDIMYRKDVNINLADRTASGIDNAARLNGIVEMINNAIERTKAYPILARKRGIEGTVYVSFRIDHDGKPEELVIQRSSGSGILDTATLAVIKKAAPFPYIESRVEIPVTYKLKNFN